MSNYWHCTSAPAAPGTPPPEDLAHWEIADPPPGLVDGQITFGQANYTSAVFADEYATAKFPYPSGAPTDMRSGSLGITPAFPGNISSLLLSSGDIPAVYAIVDAATGQCAEMAIYAVCGAEGGGVRGAIWDGTTGALLAQTVYYAPETTEGPQWFVLALETPITLVEGSSYWLGCHQSTSRNFNYSASWTPPAGSEWDETEEYVLCNTVHYDGGSDVALTVIETIGAADVVPANGYAIAMTVAETLGLADTYIRASHCWGRYAPDAEQDSNLYDDDDQQEGNLYREV